MSQFIQLHLLTSYPPANLNRDNQGRPKTASMGGTERLRISSQSLKRSWRTSDVFQQEVTEDHMGERTKLLGVEVFKNFIKHGQSFKNALAWTKDIAEQFGKLESAKDWKKLKEEDKNKIGNRQKERWQAWDTENLGIAQYEDEQLNQLFEVEISQLCFISKEEKGNVFALADRLISDNSYDYKPELDFLRETTTAVDIALFGRMLADAPRKNVEAACQVSHALSVHSVIIEDDYFTAVDDLNRDGSDAGASHIGETNFASGLFYTYVCINQSLLESNLDGDKTLAAKTLKALTQAVLKVSPSGKQNSFASRAYASYVLAEKGEELPRSLSAAFLKSVDDENYASAAINVLRKQTIMFDELYGACAEKRMELIAVEDDCQTQRPDTWEKGTLASLLTFVSE